MNTTFIIDGGAGRLITAIPALENMQSIIQTMILEFLQPLGNLSIGRIQFYRTERSI